MSPTRPLRILTWHVHGNYLYYLSQVPHVFLLPVDSQRTRGIAVVNHMARREVPLDLVGMRAEDSGGLGEIANMELPALLARYRFYFHPIRWTSLGLAAIEALMVGLPVIGLATTELVTVVRNGHSGYLDTDPHRLVEAMRRLIANPAEAALLGAHARRDAHERFAIGRFVADWQRAIDAVVR